jgi:hypothetical protein
MGELLAFVGCCIVAGVIGVLPRRRAAYSVGLALTLLLAGCGGRAGGESSGSDAALEQVRATLRAYVGTYATAESAFVEDYEPSQDMSQVIVRTRLAPGTGSLAASQKICELARNVIVEVRVEANDGTELWSCDRVNSEGSERLLAIAQLQTTTNTAAPATTEVTRRAGSVPKFVPKPRTGIKPQAASITQPPAGAGCHPSYSGECLPADASDVDCLGGDGNGPVYTKTKNIAVVGADDFDLDRDKDGIGCEDDSPAAQETEPPASDATEPPVTTTTEPPSTTQPTVPDPTEPEAACHSSYSGECLPVNAVDVDCAGGGGDGPVYAQTKNISVVGPDVYGLDANDDGVGCEP